MDERTGLSLSLWGFYGNQRGRESVDHLSWMNYKVGDQCLYFPHVPMVIAVLGMYEVVPCTLSIMSFSAQRPCHSTLETVSEGELVAVCWTWPRDRCLVLIDGHVTYKPRSGSDQDGVWWPCYGHVSGDESATCMWF